MNYKKFKTKLHMFREPFSFSNSIYKNMNLQYFAYTSIANL